MEALQNCSKASQVPACLPIIVTIVITVVAMPVHSLGDQVSSPGIRVLSVPSRPCVCVCVHAKSLQSCLTLCDPVDCGPPGSSVHGIF